MRLYIALELSRKQWKTAFTDGKRKHKIRHNFAAGNLALFQKALNEVRAEWDMSSLVNLEVYCIYEAGRDGFWIHRALESLGILNLVVDPASIEVPRKARRNKTDRQDTDSLLRLLMRYVGGETEALSVVKVPESQDEDERRREREIKQIKNEITRFTNRITSLLALEGCELAGYRKIPQQIERMRLWNGRPLPPNLTAQILRICQRMDLAREQVNALEKERREHLARPQTKADHIARRLAGFQGIGPVSSMVLSQEFFAWRDFANVRQVAACAGLVGTPCQSGDSCREQGISKAGNPRVRTLMVELAWCWLRHQPQSELSQWYQRRFGKGGKRLKRIGIVALARKLLVALWKFLTHGTPIAGARFKALPGEAKAQEQPPQKQSHQKQSHQEQSQAVAAVPESLQSGQPRNPA